MKTRELIQQLKKIHKSYFSTKDLRKFFTGKPKSLDVTAHRLVKSGRLHRLGHGLYTLDPQNVDWENLACTLRRPSYISLEYALYHHGLLEQIPETFTLVTTRKSHTISLEEKTFEYSQIKEDLYWGYEIVGNVFMATKEKALLDGLYLASRGKRSIAWSNQWLERIDAQKWREGLKRFPPVVASFIEYLENESH